MDTYACETFYRSASDASDSVMVQAKYTIRMTGIFLSFELLPRYIPLRKATVMQCILALLSSL